MVVDALPKPKLDSVLTERAYFRTRVAAAWNEYADMNGEADVEDLRTVIKLELEEYGDIAAGLLLATTYRLSAAEEKALISQLSTARDLRHEIETILIERGIRNTLSLTETFGHDLKRRTTILIAEHTSDVLLPDFINQLSTS